MTVILLTALIAGLVVLRQSVVLVVALAVAFVHAYMATKGSVEFLIQDVWYAIDREVLLSVPLFVLAGMLMARGTIAAQVVRIMKAIAAPIPGGLGIATVLALSGFGAISGTSAVTMIAIGTIMYPSLLAGGYSKSYSLGLLCCGGTLGIILPPSLLMVIYGIATEVSITKLFTAGWGPGLLLSLGLCIYTVVLYWRQPTRRFDWHELAAALRQGFAALMMPVILLGGIYSGYFTVTESAAVSVVYALFVEVVLYRELKSRELLATALETVKMLGALMPLIAIAASLNNILDLEGVPHMIVAGVRDYVTSPIMLLVVVNLLLLIAGALMDESSAILILAPLLAPLGTAYGFDPVHFAMIVIVNLQIGYVAPPVALNLLVAMVTFKESFGFICRAVVPFVLIMLAVLVVTCAVPQLSLFLIEK